MLRYGKKNATFFALRKMLAGLALRCVLLEKGS